MEFWKLFVVALMPVLKVLLITVLGTFLALDRFDILSTETARKNLNTIVFFVFLPALVCGSLAETITSRSIIALWFMPLNILLTFIIGAALGWLLVKLIRVPHHLQGLVLGCCAAGNLGNLPLIIVPAVCKQRGNPFGDMDSCHRKGLAYASLSMAMGTVYIWSIVYNIVRVYSSKIANEVKVDDYTISSDYALENDPENISKDRSQTDHVKQFEVECTNSNGRAEVPKKEKIMKKLKVLAEKMKLKALFAPATIGAIVGLIIGVVPQFRKILIINNAPLGVIQDSIAMVGDAGIPAMTLLVGANLIKGLKGLGKQLPIVVGIIVFILLLQFALPPAVAMSTITQLFGASEGECSVIMLATYSCAAFSLTLWSTFFMWLVL
ncbi:protein PIN-LIKES [Trifolium repens]|nr:protein PIN-LIKES [Trifolium repens]